MKANLTSKVEAAIAKHEVTDCTQFINKVANMDIGEYSDQAKLRSRERKLAASIAKLAATIYTPINSL